MIIVALLYLYGEYVETVAASGGQIKPVLGDRRRFLLWVCYRLFGRYLENGHLKPVFHFLPRLFTFCSNPFLTFPLPASLLFRIIWNYGWNENPSTQSSIKPGIFLFSLTLNQFGPWGASRGNLILSRSDVCSEKAGAGLNPREVQCWSHLKIPITLLIFADIPPKAFKQLSRLIRTKQYRTKGLKMIYLLHLCDIIHMLHCEGLIFT